MPRSHIVRAKRLVDAMTNNIEEGSVVMTQRALKYCPVYFKGTVVAALEDGRFRVEGFNKVERLGRPYAGAFSPKDLKIVSRT